MTILNMYTHAPSFPMRFYFDSDSFGLLITEIILTIVVTPVNGRVSLLPANSAK